MLIHDQVREFVVRQAAAKSGAASEQETAAASASAGDAEGPPELREESVTAELARLDRAYAQKVLYIVGKWQMRIQAGTSILRIVLRTFPWIRDNTSAKISNLKLAMERVVKEI